MSLDAPRTCSIPARIAATSRMTCRSGQTPASPGDAYGAAQPVRHNRISNQPDFRIRRFQGEVSANPTRRRHPKPVERAVAGVLDER